MNTSTHIYATVTPHPLTIPSDVLSGKYPLIDPEALAAMRERSASPDERWPETRWAAAQNVELGHPGLGHLKFVAVGPGRTIQTVESPTLPHWRYYFVGWVNLATGTIQPEVP